MPSSHGGSRRFEYRAAHWTYDESQRELQFSSDPCGDQNECKSAWWRSNASIRATLDRLSGQLRAERTGWRRIYTRGSKPEYRFLYRHAHPRLPVCAKASSRSSVGAMSGESRAPSAHRLDVAVNSGGRRLGRHEAVLVDIPANCGLQRRGVWFLIEVGIRGLLMPDEQGMAVCYMICEPASQYYRIKTGSPRMPVLIDQRI